MPDKKINELTPLTDPQVNDDTKLLVAAVASTGVAFSFTMAQLKALLGISTMEYVATGAEGTTITIAGLAAKNIILIIREGNPLHLKASAPDSAEYTWNSLNVGLGAATNPGERFRIIYNG